MIESIRLKVCGITSVADAELAVGAGADYLGFILYPKSPRAVTIAAFQAMKASLPAGAKTVGVLVEPSFGDLEAIKDVGFDFVQVEFPNETPFFEVAMWTEAIPPDRLWLAPRVPPGAEPDPAFFPLADVVVLDAFESDIRGLGGKTSSWDTAHRVKGRFQKVHWVLAGGIKAENVGAALAQTGVTTIEVNSGVEGAPGKKDAALLAGFAEAVRSAVAGGSADAGSGVVNA